MIVFITIINVDCDILRLIVSLSSHCSRSYYYIVEKTFSKAIYTIRHFFRDTIGNQNGV